MPQRSTGARVYLTVIGLLLALAGSVFTWLMWRSFDRAREVEGWPSVPCVILRSEAEERQIDPGGPVERRFGVLFGYEWQGKAFESERLRLRGSPWTGKAEGIAELLEKYPVGARTECRVDPEDPSMAVLERESKGPGYSLWFPVLFVVGGLGIVAGAWRR